VEYGDERDPKMREFLERIAPANKAKNITKPLFVIAGQNDPRVPASESAQMVAVVRKNGTPVWWLPGQDEGHGFAKKKNRDYQFMPRDVCEGVFAEVAKSRVIPRFARDDSVKRSELAVGLLSSLASQIGCERRGLAALWKLTSNGGRKERWRERGEMAS